MIRDQEMLDQFLDSISKFVRERLVPAENEVAENDAIPDDIVQEMKAMGLFGMTIPEEYDGLGLTMEEEALVAIELGRTSPAFRSLIGTNNGIGSAAIVFDGTEKQKKTYLPKYASGEIIGAFCLTEPDVGSDASAVKTSAIKQGNEYIINGTKRYITNAPRAGTFTVMARTDPSIKGAKGISAFIVDASTPGITLGPKDKKMGQQGSHTCDVIFENCRVPAENIIGGVAGKGFITSMKVLDRGRLHISALSVGIAERLIDDALRYAIDRTQFGKAIAEHQMIQVMLADSKAEAYAAKCMVLDAARQKDLGKKITTEASCCKLFATEMVGRVADKAVQIHGGAGYISEYAVERLYRDVRLFRLYEGTTQIQQMIIAKNMIKDIQ
ncbi:acyl-CoA dehydrogenase family protein [Colwellia sp. MB02u-18]|uniref:acyl-CoA dehydrogenase family protein n=1 Tax=unclassified Colwellia TaxID=196834 RepID=UPI0015F6D617|nr:MULTISPECIES: acyl-CoA dehydrogenase family protein [unclassified Colwellia]MBA6222791.1 acyl-CoA dehydrogenase family protein [Colwellia sp. MB3u-45]MBA6266002.1 acyl-CoA dehydrogenase family protein [Colwellia sp. MB3u-43]MBA6320442.1 acyl-CoA dehydrogenase family protein [Colwellia sp. MB02u-19]MBA6323329.1 acyl-CoA dehydrogenase family protein [Colwellia sp. MB02u-18]MBA6329827.1 acyl-CoA dehydrogenase family protein [Colwellia sp. MB02u-12]